MEKQVHACRGQDKNIQDLYKTHYDIRYGNQSRRRHNKATPENRRDENFENIKGYDIRTQGDIKDVVKWSRNRRRERDKKIAKDDSQHRQNLMEATAGFVKDKQDAILQQRSLYALMLVL